MDEAVYRTALEKVKPEYRAAFEKFVKTGNANMEFLSYLDTDKGVQEAVDMVFSSEADELGDRVRKLLKEKPSE